MVPAIAAACAALELGLAASGLSGTALAACLLALVALAVGASLFESMNLRRERAPLRAIILVPLGLSILAAVALIIEGAYRAHLIHP